MPNHTDAQPIAIVTACVNRGGTPELHLVTVEATPSQIDQGIHYYFAEAELLERGYEGPFVHFDELESPPFLHPAVRCYLAVQRCPSPQPSTEEHACPA